MPPATFPSPPAVTLRQISRTFPGQIHALSSIDLDIPSGQFISLLGPSGCGKSTLLRIIAGLDHPDHGVVTASSTSLGYVFQDAHLLPWRTILKNVSLPLELEPSLNSHHTDAAMTILQQVGLEDFARKYPNQLSGGMKMRVSLARALVTRPKLLLMDEPFAALDEITRQHLDEMLRSLWKTLGMTIIFVTHSIAEAAYLAQRVVVMTRRPGRIVLDHPIELPEDRPAEIRGDPAFAHQTRILYDALKHGMT